MFLKRHSNQLLFVINKKSNHTRNPFYQKTDKNLFITFFHIKVICLPREKSLKFTFLEEEKKSNFHHNFPQGNKDHGIAYLTFLYILPAVFFSVRSFRLPCFLQYNKFSFQYHFKHSVRIFYIELFFSIFFLYIFHCSCCFLVKYIFILLGILFYYKFSPKSLSSYMIDEYFFLLLLFCTHLLCVV